MNLKKLTKPVAFELFQKPQRPGREDLFHQDSSNYSPTCTSHGSIYTTEAVSYVMIQMASVMVWLEKTSSCCLRVFHAIFGDNITTPGFKPSFRLRSGPWILERWNKSSWRRLLRRRGRRPSMGHPTGPGGEFFQFLGHVNGWKKYAPIDVANAMIM